MASQNSFLTPLIRENPVTFHVLGICAALAITNSLTSSLIMSVAMTTVLVIIIVAVQLKWVPSIYDTRLVVDSWESFGLQIRQMFLVAISFLVCMVGITNAMLMSITERFREIATMKACS